MNIDDFFKNTRIDGQEALNEAFVERLNDQINDKFMQKLTNPGTQFSLSKVLNWRSIGVGSLATLMLATYAGSTLVVPSLTKEKTPEEIVVEDTQDDEIQAFTPTEIPLSPTEEVDDSADVSPTPIISITSTTLQPQATLTSGSISLSASLIDMDTISISWETQNLDTLKGFKLYRDLDADTEDEDGIFISDPAKAGYSIHATPGNTYYIQLCQYLGKEKCGVYSNVVTVVVPPKK